MAQNINLLLSWDDDPDPKMRGYQLMTNEEIFRGRYLVRFDQGRPIINPLPGQKVDSGSLQAAVTVHAEPADVAALRGLDLAEICITSAGTLTTEPAPANAFRLPEVAGVAVTVGLAPGEKCQRCWRILPEVGVVHPELCRRCADVCPVGADYEAMLADAHTEIPENTPQKEGRLAAMTGRSGGYEKQKRYIGVLKQI